VKSTSEITHLNTLAYLYDHQSEFPVWVRRLTHRQLVDIAKLMIAWHSTSGGKGIVPIEEVEQREVIRAIALCGGDVTKAARALNMGKSTIYTKLRRWGYSIENRLLIHQASALTQGTGEVRDRLISRV
jgi:transcriptional regulator with GAF, ATPase, and Fis domain